MAKAKGKNQGVCLTKGHHSMISLGHEKATGDNEIEAGRSVSGEDKRSGALFTGSVIHVKDQGSKKFVAVIYLECTKAGFRQGRSRKGLLGDGGPDTGMLTLEINNGPTVEDVPVEYIDADGDKPC